MLNQSTNTTPSSLVLMKPGTDEPPFFITHGLGGDVMELSKIVEHIQTRHPVYGVQWKGLDGTEPPDNSIDDMAQYFMDAIIERQNHGPYLLAGLSIGGLPMLEVAHRLVARGEEVALLAFLDTYPHPRYWPLKCWAEVLARRFRHHFLLLTNLPFRHAAPRLLELCKSFVGHLRSRRGASPNPSQKVGLSDQLALQLLRESAMEAFACYQPPYYRGKLTILKAEVATTFPSNPAEVWGTLASQIEIHSIQCNHVGLIASHADAVAAKLSLCLEKALQKK